MCVSSPNSVTSQLTLFSVGNGVGGVLEPPVRRLEPSIGEWTHLLNWTCTKGHGGLAVVCVPITYIYIYITNLYL